MASSVRHRHIPIAECKHSDLMSSLALRGGQCLGGVVYWLCLHYSVLSEISDSDDLIKKENQFVAQLQNNNIDVISIQDALTKRAKKETPLSFSEIKTCSLSKVDNLVIQTRQEKEFKSHDNVKDRAAEFQARVQEIIEQQPSHALIEFGYYWRSRHGSFGHSTGMIKNPCRGCELLFFDINYGVFAFSRAQDFYESFIPFYVEDVFGKECIPTKFDYSTLSNPGLTLTKTLDDESKLIPRPRVSTEYSTSTIPLSKRKASTHMLTTHTGFYRPPVPVERDFHVIQIWEDCAIDIAPEVALPQPNKR